MDNVVTNISLALTWFAVLCISTQDKSWVEGSMMTEDPKICMKRVGCWKKKIKWAKDVSYWSYQFNEKKKNKRKKEKKREKRFKRINAEEVKVISKKGTRERREENKNMG